MGSIETQMSGTETTTHALQKKNCTARMTKNHTAYDTRHMTDSTENVTLPKCIKSRNQNSSVQIQIRPKSPFKSVPRDFEESEFLDLVDLGDVAFAVQTIKKYCCG